MTRIRHIVVATDFSHAAERAVRRAARLAEQHGAALRLLHVMPGLGMMRGLSRYGAASRATVARAAHLALESVADRIRRQHGLEASLALVSGAAHRGITAACRRTPVDLLVVGALGEHARLLQRAFGGTAARLIDAVPCPLLVVRRPPHDDCRLQLIAVDLTPRSARVVTRAAALLPGSRIALAAS